MSNIKIFNRGAVDCTTPATARVLVSRRVDGSLEIQSTLETAEETVELLDKGMEAIDGQRLPPNIG